ncbi:calcium-binding protein [Ruegeria aquimaris]|uniref:Calcium-binding protein n=1 Tax=Ruegeria aquimaris TaxID=2984333 RepID=A0ABT3ASU0_9RHOB|nr:calcium-binding protein [Ruegeria sp. XHP0148]MCV2891211.1 calcium-binding protein [Ruegeria sp. XHP0148]
MTWEIPKALWDEPWARDIFGPVTVIHPETEREQRFLVATVYQEITNEAGFGGDGGNGGTGGAAATIINHGTLNGNAALPGGDPRSGPANTAESGSGGDAGRAGRGGESFGGEGGTELGPAERLDHNGLLTGAAGDSFFQASQDSSFVNAVREEIRGWDLDAPGSNSFPITGQAANGSAGRFGADGNIGSPGLAGDAATGVLTSSTGMSSYTAGDTLVYLHNIGQDPETGKIAFNIIRVGDPLTAFDIGWSVTGDGSSPVSAADFAPGTALSGTLSFDVLTITRENADGSYADRFQPASDGPDNVRRVELEVIGDLLTEVPEGYRITLTTEIGGPLLGTHTRTGTLVGTMLGATGPLRGTPGPDTLDGTPGPDEIKGLAGNDLLRGFEGNDGLRAGDGADTINGGPGDDTITGGHTGDDLRDVIYAGDGNDSVDAGAGNDLVYGQGGNDTIAGGAGVDELQGQDGDDVITGSSFSDLVYGGAGDDFVNGGFGHDRINGGSGADKFFHVGVEGHGSDWVQDYNSAAGDVLLFGNASATRAQFQVNFAHTANADGERAGDDAVQEAFVIYRPTGQIMWALVDGTGQESINLQIGADVFDLLA